MDPVTYSQRPVSAIRHERDLKDRDKTLSTKPRTATGGVEELPDLNLTSTAAPSSSVSSSVSSSSGSSFSNAPSVKPQTQAGGSGGIFSSGNMSPIFPTSGTFFSKYRVVQIAMIVEALSLLPVAIGHFWTPEKSIQRLFDKDVALSELSQIFVQLWGLASISLSLSLLFVATLPNFSSLTANLRLFVYLSELVGELPAIVLLSRLIHRLGTWNSNSIIYIGGSVAFAFFHLIAVSMRHRGWFGVADPQWPDLFKHVSRQIQSNINSVSSTFAEEQDVNKRKVH